MPLTDFSPYLKNGVLDLNKEGNKFSSGKGGIRCFKDIFDIEQLAEFIKTTPDITAFKAAMWGIGEMGIDNFRSLMEAINNSDITVLNLDSNTLTLEMVNEISKLELTGLNLSFCDIDDEKITKIVDGLPNLLALYASSNCITDLGAEKIAEGLNEIEELVLPYCNKISCEKLQQIADAHKETLTVFDAFSDVYSAEQIGEISNLLPNCVFQLGPYWTRGVNNYNDAPLPLARAVWANNNAPPLVGVVENLEG